MEYDNPHASMRAIRELNNTELKGRLIFVREDREDKKITGAWRALVWGVDDIVHIYERMYDHH